LGILLSLPLLLGVAIWKQEQEEIDSIIYICPFLYILVIIIFRVLLQHKKNTNRFMYHCH